MQRFRQAASIIAGVFCIAACHAPLGNAADNTPPAPNVVSPPVLHVPNVVEQKSDVHSVSAAASAGRSVATQDVFQTIPTQFDGAVQQAVSYRRLYGYPHFRRSASRYYGVGAPYYGYTPGSNYGFQYNTQTYRGYYPYRYSYRPTFAYYQPSYAYSNYYYRSYYRPWYTYAPGASAYQYGYRYQYPRNYYPQIGFQYRNYRRPYGIGFFYGY